MTAESCTVLFGIRFDIAEDEIDSVEDRTHPLVKKGRGVGLQAFYNDFGTEEPRYTGFIGRVIAEIGEMHKLEASLSEAELQKIFAQVRAKLAQAGISEEPRLHMGWSPPTS